MTYRFLVMAIYLNSRGFAFVIFEGELAPLDWSIVEARGSEKREKILAPVRQQFAYLGSVTKDAIAMAIAKHIPAFERFLPRPRKPWESEDARMGIFDAAALALTFFHTMTT
jgi:hypothetical protein